MTTEIDVYKEWLGIPEGDRPPDHYQLLRLVQFEDDVEKIRKNYKKLNAHVRKYATGNYYLQSQDLLNELAKAMLCLTDPERKQEYDESQGREFDEAAKDVLGRKPLAKVLQDWGIIERAQAKELEDFADKRGLSLRDAAVQMKMTDIETATKALAVELGRSYLEIEDMLPDDSVLDQVPRQLVKQHSFLPLFIDDDMLLVACSDEPDHHLEEDLRVRFGTHLRAVIASPLAINQAIAKYYAPGARSESAADTKTKSGKTGKPVNKPKEKTAKKSADAPAADSEQKFMMELLFSCWAIIGSVVVDQFVMKTLVLPQSWAYSSYILTVFAVIGVGTYWFALRKK
ncbi:MAG: general secretion pathway protein GspE [Planctomycetota bacterium]|jgi:hypothetical protein|nr:general secretion pathway protein GspE [Planctomycetota bacterium]MDA1213695.1 general secretion pathway protein GspE [Planctomycetota bacterium]